MSERREPVRISRRSALGAAAAGAVLGAGGRTAIAAPDDPVGPVNDPSFVADGLDIPDIAPAPASPGTRYVSVAGIDFKPASNSGASPTEYSSGAGELASSSSAGTYSAAVPLPHGARITELVVYATRPDLASTVVRLVSHRSSVAGNSAFIVVAQINTNAQPAASTVQTYTANVGAGAPDAVVDTATSAYFVHADPPANDEHKLWGVRVGYVTADAGRFFPIDPVRAYDSRATLPQPGLLAPNTSRLVLTKDGRANGSGDVIAADVVPPGATAIACNLTVTGTTGPNFLALTPGDAASFTASAINWTGADQSVANGLIAKLDVNRFVKVWCGDQTGSTHVILDVNGYWL